SAHVFCHEMGAAAINRRHPVTAIIRESGDRIREAMKAKWYQATGMTTLHRSRHSSLMADTMAYLRVLRSGQILAVTPDVIYPQDNGVRVETFGRPVTLSPGCVVLAMRSGAPLVCVWGEWVAGERPGEERMKAIFDEPIEVPKTGDRDAMIRET